MKITEISEKERIAYNKIVTHPLQSYEWGEFRKKTGVKVIRQGFSSQGKLIDGFTLTIHKIPRLPFTIGYLPKSTLPTKNLISELKKIGKNEKCLFIQLEPNVIKNDESEKMMTALSLKPSAHPLFTPHTFVLDLTKSEDELLASFHPKTRYNIKIARKHNVTITERNTTESFTTYLRLTEETTKRQRFFAHSPNYHTQQWETLPHEAKSPYTTLSSHLFLANYNMKTLAAWMLFVFKDTLYYPYGASSNEHRETMSSNLMMWEIIKFGKKLGLKKLDMWGALGSDPDPHDPWYGFHRFKQGYRPTPTEFVGSFDLVINPVLYPLYTTADKLRWLALKLR